MKYRDQRLSHAPNIEPAIKYMIEKNFDSNTTSILLLTHKKSKKIQKMTEVYHYSPLKFIGDSGGTIGIFVGLSFYSIYLELSELFYKKVYPLVCKWN